MSTHYETLGVCENATAEEIKAAYRALARKLHPDVSGRDSTREFQALQAAHAILEDPEKRIMYDFSLKKAPSLPPSTLVDAINQAMGDNDAFGIFHGDPKKKKRSQKKSRKRRGTRQNVADVELDGIPDGIFDDDSLGGIF